MKKPTNLKIQHSEITPAEFDAVLVEHLEWKSAVPNSSRALLVCRLIKDQTFSDQNLDWLSLSDCKVDNCKFINCQMSHVYFINKTVVSGCTFENCIFDRAEFNTASIKGCKFFNCSFGQTKFDFSTIVNTCFENNKFSKPEFYFGKLDRISFCDSIADFVDNSVFVNLEITGSLVSFLMLQDLPGCKLSKSSFYGVPNEKYLLSTQI